MMLEPILHFGISGFCRGNVYHRHVQRLENDRPLFCQATFSASGSTQNKFTHKKSPHWAKLVEEFPLLSHARQR
jgi:FtsZ-interacting cell division protein ZipA